ncbi:uncharacterized protein B0I36DRAFT_378380 [Microdochium trichocladiopsis]|uniref:NACHT domain-containing protein n=1 Tax=Microdochium trichocladiopsis TaxID=1682393 RepID=A0A9P9BLD6_9PEZI|nr:uncharacterized protein B0I36DRAFT_378380 [Microdochium trichocladiopsis]KAH7012684.1 hypothetical protein B0I36DRAFT_378380 [Microdochium trichocladiopsis]
MLSLPRPLRGLIQSQTDRCLADLRTTDPRIDKKRIEDTQGGLLHSVSSWTFTNDDFLRWRDGEASLLWIKGDPGKGKTMLLCGIIDELSPATKLKNKDANTLLSYFFCQAANLAINNATAVVKQQPILISHLRDKYNDDGRALFEDHNAWWTLADTFQGILQDPILGPSCFVVDALDECRNYSELQLVIETSSTSRAKWIVSSRNWPDIEERLGMTQSKVTLRLELNTTSISRAVSIYIQHMVGKLARQKSYDQSTLGAIGEYLQSNSDNTFLWVALVCQELGKDVATDFPPGLEPFYCRMIGQVSQSNDSDLLNRILATATIVYRPITFHELKTIIELPQYLNDNPRFLVDVIEHCGSFSTLRNNTIYFIHQSAKDFLLSKSTNQLFKYGIRHQHGEIFTQALQTISSALHRTMYDLQEPGCIIHEIQPPNSDPLAAIAYSRVYWIDHLLDARSNSIETHQLGLINFLETKSLYWLEALSLLRKVQEGARAITSLRHHLSTLEGHGGFVNSVAFSPDSQRLASASYTKTVMIWDAATGIHMPKTCLRDLHVWTFSKIWIGVYFGGLIQCLNQEYWSWLNAET